MRNGHFRPGGLALTVAMTVALATGRVLAQAAGWWDGFAEHGLWTKAEALSVYNGDVVVGGWFPYAQGPLLAVNNIARWDGSQWHALGRGIDDFPCPEVPLCEGRVLSLAADGNMLYVGGLFPSVDRGLPARNIAAWDGTNWSMLGTGTNGHVENLTIYRGDLIAAGSFSEVDGQSISWIARWDGASWESLGFGVDNDVIDMVVHDDRLVVVGTFNNAGGVTAHHVAGWDGTEWAAIGEGFPHSGLTVVDVYQGRLIIGETTLAEPQGIRGYALWNGASWEQFAPRTGTNAHCMVVFQDELIVGGLVNAQANGIVRWNGSTWVELDGGVAPGDRLPYASVEALAVLDDHLFVAGTFAEAGGIKSPFIARWDGEPTPVLVADFEAAPFPSETRVAWRLDPTSLRDVTGVWLQRSDSELGPFARVSPYLVPEPVMSYVDREVGVGSASFYRLEFALADGTHEVSRIISVAAVSVSPALISSTWTDDGSAFEIRYHVGPVGREVRLAVFDVRGRLIRNVFQGWSDPGTHTARWTLTDGAERQAPNGVYFLQLVSGRATDRQRLTVVR